MSRHPTREAEMIRKAKYRIGYSPQQVANLLGIQIRQYQGSMRFIFACYEPLRAA